MGIIKGITIGLLIGSVMLNWALLTGRLIQPEQDYLAQVARTYEN